MMYCPKFPFRISYNNFSGERCGGCWDVHREEADRKTRCVAVSLLLVFILEYIVGYL